jgi:hypothetical protein
LRFVINILIKDKESNPVCYHELIISNQEAAIEEAKVFQKKFVLEPEKYINIKINKK